MKRTIAAFLIAPLIPSIIFLPGAGAAVAVGYSYAFSYILGIPIFLVLRKKKKESHLLYGSLGFVIGALYVLVPAIPDIRMLDSNGVIAALMFATIGATVALCFSIIHGPERKTPIQPPQKTTVAENGVRAIGFGFPIGSIFYCNKRLSRDAKNEPCVGLIGTPDADRNAPAFNSRQTPAE